MLVSRRLCVFLLWIAPLIVASDGWAGAVKIDFDFSSSTVRARALLFEVKIPDHGTIVSSSGSLFAPASGSATVLPGPAAFDNLGLLADLGGSITVTSGTVVTQIGIDGYVGFLQNSPAFATLGSSLASMVVSALGLDINALLTLQLPTGSLPVSLTTSTVVGPVAFRFANLNRVGSGSVTASVPFSIGGGLATGTVNLIGREIGRTFAVPEPGRSGLLMGGVVAVLALAGGARAWARRSDARR